MNEILGSIIKVEDDDYQGKEFKKVTLADGQVLKVKYGREGSLKAKWGLLQEGKAIKFTMGEYSGKPFVQDIESIADGLAPPTTPAPPIQQETGRVDTPKLVQQAQHIATLDAKTQDIHEQVALKEVGELYRVGALKESNTDISPEHAKKLKHAYFNWIFKALGIDVQYE